MTPTSGADTPDPETFAGAVASAVSDAGLAARVAVQSFDWRTLAVMRRIAPEIERVCLTIDGGGGIRSSAAARRLAMDGRPRHRRFRRLGAAAGGRGRMYGVVAQLSQRDRASAGGSNSLRLQVIPWTVNQRADMARLIQMGVTASSPTIRTACAP